MGDKAEVTFCGFIYSYYSFFFIFPTVYTYYLEFESFIKQ